MQWQTPSYQLFTSSPYRIQVDDNPNFGSLNKDYYTANTSYTPSLSEGTWYWRVKAKDSSGTWSDWSSVWRFTYTTSNPSPTPSSSPTPTPTPTSPTSSSNPSPAITISNIPSSTDVNQQFNVIVNLSSFPANTNLYLKGAFKKTDSSNYFGQTLVNNNWVKNYQTYTSQLPITTDSSGSLDLNLTVKGDPDDSGYTGEGDYIFKVGYYLDQAVSWSNETTIHLSGNKPTTASTTQDAPAKDSIPPSTFKPLLSKSQSAPRFNLPSSLLGTSAASISSTPISQSSHLDEKTAVFKTDKLIIFTGIFFIISGSIILAYAILHNRFTKPN